MKSQLWRTVVARLPIALHTQVVIVEIVVPELAKAGLLETSRRRGFLSRFYQVYWWVATIIVLLIPTKPDQTGLYFPAVVALAAAWLFAIPAYAQSLVRSADFTGLRPSPTLFSDFIQRMRSRPIKLPSGLENEAEVAEASALFARELPAIIPAVLLSTMATLSTRVVVAAIVGAIGLLIGPWLASITVSSLHGWSPVAILYALTAPVLPLLLFSTLIPIIGYAYLAYRRSGDQPNGDDIPP